VASTLILADVDDRHVAAYLARIGLQVHPLDASYLQDLQRSHLLSVPFESLSIHLGERISLAEEALFDKIVTRRRGGFCYELNGLFAELLTALGYEVTRLAASVYTGQSVGPPLDHLALRVAADDERWLVDVGFGAFAQHPLRFDVRGDQADPAGTYRIEQLDNGDVLVSENGAPTYLLEPRPRQLAEFSPTCWWQQTSPESHFTIAPICSILTEDGRVTVRGRTLIETRSDLRRERDVDNDAELLTIYRDRFGIDLARVPLPPPVSQSDAMPVRSHQELI
jgi:N-hydroxyarylamine O-acetyltransferase